MSADEAGDAFAEWPTTFPNASCVALFVVSTIARFFSYPLHEDPSSTRIAA